MSDIVAITDRLSLRELHEDDWRAVNEYDADPDVVRFMDFGPNTEEDTRAFIGRAIEARKQEPRLLHDLLIVLKESGKVIGGCGIHVADWEQREAFIGYLLRRDSWGNGYATETARALLKFGFETLRMRRIYAYCDVGNLSSAQVLKKCGMHKEGLLREHVLRRGELRDDFMFAILDHEWRAQSEKYPSWPIRQAVPEDVGSLRRLFAQVDEFHQRALPGMFRNPPENVRGMDFFDSVFADEDSAILVAEADGIVSGLVLVEIRERPDIPVIVPGRYAVIGDVVVDQEFRKCGIGKSLMLEAENWIKNQGVDLVELNVWEFNSNAIRFYEELGYENASRKMWKRL